MEYLFDHEKLKAYQEAIQFVAWLAPRLEHLKKCRVMHDQLERASTSIVLNLAEGNARFSMKERARYLEIASGSTMECAAALDVLCAQGYLTQPDTTAGKRILKRVAGLIIGLRTNAQNRIAEVGVMYGGEELE
ncbi:MAG: four helix bundle protein [candidate division KSB1 bacterium]|nr:four helix bundle protein [candidate division KSB1 bacterium]MDZ7274634.1 four helix bundle protein [candidate division KSB1 bacterium]MDZ7285459.1 four helix bundle protein [candidate division KSB1 bacterium]MDZ7298491.1 four helix bundle protein [candidate division KSB1 bacterium]MDZ7349355.1 four helix bundle protein [candidate division KSB1 bacterium]